MEQIGKDLLNQFVYMDEKLNLYSADGSFEIPLSVTAAKLFSPVLKANLESPYASIEPKEKQKSDERSAITKGGNGTSVSNRGSLRRIEIKDFDSQTVQHFIRSLQGQLNEDELKTFTWKQAVELLKIFHFYDVENMYQQVLEKARTLIQQANVVEAIAYMETFGYQQKWCDHIVGSVLANYKNIFQTQVWKDSIVNYPNTQSQIQYHFLKRLGY